MLTTVPRGTKDILPSDIQAWRYLEATMREICAQYCYQEIRTPIFEHTELFLRGIGDTTDVVEKEMYTFNDRGGRSITLRPENTASVVRSYVENKMYAEANNATKLFYIGPMFRYDRPQAGRYRQFHQFGIEALGVKGPNIDAETILLAVQILNTLGLKELALKINSVGCPNCRPRYKEILQDYFRPHLDDMCGDCKSRFERNPLRLLDCKSPHDQAIAQAAPSLEECLCEECKDHFEQLKAFLDIAGVSYIVDHNLVRGLDYYTKTAFEIQYTPLGSQSAVCGGGRYDGLVEQVGGPSTPGIGFAMGMERVLLALEKQNLLPEFGHGIDAYIISPNKELNLLAFKEVITLRKAGLKVEFDFFSRSIKAQMKQANKLKAKYVLILGEDEVARDCIVLKNMINGEQSEIPIKNILSILQTEV